MSDKSLAAQAGLPAGSDNEMVVNGDPERPRGFGDFPGQLDIGLAGRGISGWMVMDEDQPASMQVDGAADNLAHIDGGLVGGASLDPVHFARICRSF